jgi:hypothetical protein
MTLIDEGGLTINNNKKIEIKADGDIQITSLSKLVVVGENEVNFIQGGSSKLVGIR